MKIVVAARCYNNVHYVNRFLRGYDFADQIVISDGGSTDGSIEALTGRDKVKLIHFDQKQNIGGFEFNEDAPHMNFVLDAAKALDPDWLIFDDFDCVPNAMLRITSRLIFEHCREPQVNAFRLYMWGDKEYFPTMNNRFDPNYTSLWAWKPKEIEIRADLSTRHGTLIGLYGDPLRLKPQTCLLHKSWHPDTIQAKIDKYNAIGLPMNHPLNFAGVPEKLPPWAREG